MSKLAARLDRIAAAAARGLLAWIAGRLDPAGQIWLQALQAELGVIDGGWAQLAWAVGGLQFLWFDPRRQMGRVAYRFGPFLVLLAGAILLIDFTLMQHTVVITLTLVVLTGLCMLITVPLLMVLEQALRRLLAGWPGAPRLGQAQVRRVRSAVTIAVGLLGLGLSAALVVNARAALSQLPPEPANVGVVTTFADHQVVAALLSQATTIPTADVHLFTQAKPLAVNDVPLEQLLRDTAEVLRPHLPAGWQPPLLPAELQQLVNKFSGIQGYDLAHGQLPNGAQIAFGSDLGSRGPGPDQIIGPPGRLLDSGDANTFNVLIPLEHVGVKLEPGAVGRGCCPDYVTYNGDLISVQSLVTGQILKLRVVGEYDSSDGTLSPLFGKVLADDSVVQALSGGHPSYAYSLRLNTPQTAALMARLHAAAPTAQVYNFAGDPGVVETKPGYTILTDAGDLELGWALTNPRPLFEAALSMALLAAIIVVAGREARRIANSPGQAV